MDTTEKQGQVPQHRSLVWRHGPAAGFASLLLAAGASASCSGAAPGTAADETTATSTAALTEDGLADAYNTFKNLFTLDAQDQTFTIGFGYHPGLSTSKILVNGTPANGQAKITFATGVVTATLNAPTSSLFDLYFVKNTPGVGTVKPESTDTIFKVGSFTPNPNVPNQHTLSVNIGTAPFPQPGINFDLDLIVVTPRGQSPTAKITAIGARTLFEKRFFRERAGSTLDPVTGTLANFIESNDPLVQRGAQLFVNETFAGNGRKCATCHPLGNNQTIDPTFVASLPPNDPLFVFPTGLEDPTMLPHALIRENVDGLEQPTVKFVERAVPHTLSMSTSIGEVGTALGQSNNEGNGQIDDGPPPDQHAGWSGDGAPGRGTLTEFAFGAVVQHFTLSLNRVPGKDFRIPTQEELDALEAFQIFNGRQHNPTVPALQFADPAAAAGGVSAVAEGKCIQCHIEISGGNSVAVNFDINTGVENLAIPFRTSSNMPKDGGFGVSPGTIPTGFGDGQFNVPPLFEAADTAPFFHNNAVSVIEDAVAFYQTPQFLASPGAQFATPQLTAQSIQNIGAFLRTLNALENIAQVRKRAQYLQNNTTQGGTTIMNNAIRDTQDAIHDLTAPSLSSTASQNAISALKTVELLLQNTLPFANSQPTSTMIQVTTWLQIAENDLLTANPNHEF